MFAVYAGTTPEQGPEVLGLIRSELNQVVSDGISDCELTSFKEQMKTGFQMSLESSNSRMHRMGKAELCLGRVLDEQQVLARIDAVKTDDLQALAQGLLRHDPVIVAVGPEHASQRLEGLL